VQGKATWTMMMPTSIDKGPDGCAPVDGSVRVEDGSGAILRISTPRPKLRSIKRSGGLVTVKCESDYSVEVPAQPVYRVTFDHDPSLLASSTCDVSGTYTATANSNSPGPTRMPEIYDIFACY
jgi:hypothetical protein